MFGDNIGDVSISTSEISDNCVLYFRLRMKKALLLIALTLFVGFRGSAQTISEIQDRMLELAGQNDTQELPQLFSQYKNKIEPYVRYCCGAIVSMGSANNQETLVYIDSLLTVTPHFFDKNSKSSFAYYKATVLQQEGRYEELIDFCEKYIAEEQLEPTDYLENELQSLRVGGINNRRPTTVKEQLLWLADNGDPFELKMMYEANKDSADSYIRFNCERSLAQAFNDNERALVCIDSLIGFYSSRMDIKTILKNICHKVNILFHEGEYNAFAEYVENLPEEYKTAPDLNFASQLAKSLKGMSSAEIIRPPKDCVIPSIALLFNRLLLPGKVNDKEIPLLFDTWAAYTTIKGSLAQEAKVRILPDSITVNWFLADMDSRGSLAVVDSLRIGDILLKNRIVFVDYSSEAPLSDNLIYFGAPEIKSIGQIDFYPDKVILPYNSRMKNEEPNFFLKGVLAWIPCSLGEKSYPFIFDTGSPDNYLSIPAFLSSSQSLYDTKISVDKKKVRFKAFNLNDNKNILGYSFVRSFPEFSINYNTMRMNFDTTSFRIQQRHWILGRDFFELEKYLQKDDLNYYYLGKSFILDGKNKPDNLLCFLDTALTYINKRDTITSKKERNSILLTLQAIQENAFYDSGQYEASYNCLSEMRSVCPEYLLPSLEVARKICKALCAIKPQQIVWKGKQTVLKPSATINDKFYYPLKINGEKTCAIMTLGASKCIISNKEAQRLGMNIVSDSVDFDGVVSKLGVAETIHLGKVIAKNIIFYILPGDSTVTQIGQSLLRLIPTIELSEEQLVLRKDSQNKHGNVIPIRFEKPDLLAQINSSKGCMVVKLVEGKGNIVPQSYVTAEDVRLGNIPIDLNGCSLDGNLDLKIDMRGTIGIHSLLQHADRIVFDLKNMTIMFLE